MEEIKLLFVGDIVFIEEKKIFLKDDFKKMIEEHDIASCNFEAPIYPDANVKRGGFALQHVKSSNYPKNDKLAIRKAFSPHLFQDPTAPKTVKDGGFNVINLATNHMYDYGQTALKETLNAFEKQLKIGAGLDFQSAYELKIKDIKGIKIGFLSYAESEFGALTYEKMNRGGFAWINHPSINTRIKEAKKIVDILIIQAHAGPEKTDLPLPEWRARYKEFIEFGADAIIGHHPHVPQGWEIYKGKPIFYSLGNFSFDTVNPHPLWHYGIAASLTFKGSELKKYEAIPVLNTDDGVGICNDKNFNDHLQNLCEMIKPEAYEDLINKQTLDLWKNHYKNIYSSSLNRLPCTGIYTLLWRITNKILNKLSLWDNLSLLHNLRIESHHLVVKRALELLEESNLSNDSITKNKRS